MRWTSPAGTGRSTAARSRRPPPYVIGRRGIPEPAPFVRAPDKKAVVYLHRTTRRIVHQNAEGTHDLTAPLADAEMPTVTFDTSSRHIALTKNDARIFDTRGWKSTLLPGVRRIHDFNAGGVVAATTSSALVFDLRGKKRMSLPLRESDADTYRLRPDGRRLVFIRDPEASLATYDTETGRLLADVSPTFPGEGEGLDAGLGWSEQGAFLVRAYLSHRVYNLDLSTGKLWRHTKKH